jgi:hypothetical protein
MGERPRVPVMADDDVSAMSTEISLTKQDDDVPIDWTNQSDISSAKRDTLETNTFGTRHSERFLELLPDIFTKLDTLQKDIESAKEEIRVLMDGST